MNFLNIKMHACIKYRQFFFKQFLPLENTQRTGIEKMKVIFHLFSKGEGSFKNLESLELDLSFMHLELVKQSQKVNRRSKS